MRGHRAGRDLFIPERPDPAEYRCDLAGAHVAEPVVRDEPGGLAEVARRYRVADRLVRRPVFGVPGAGPAMQFGNQVRLDLRELAAEHLGEQVVISVPLPGVVQRDDEQVFPLEDLDQVRRAGRFGDGGAQRRAEPAEDGGPGEKLLHLARLAAQYLLSQEIDDEPVVAGELA